MPSSPADPTQQQPRPFPQSLCWQCTHCRVVRGARTTFLQCQAYGRSYPPQPVLSCLEHAPKPSNPTKATHDA